MQASQSLVNNFVGLTQALPGIGRRLQEVQGIENQGEGGKRVAHPGLGGGCLPILRGGVGVKLWRRGGIGHAGLAYKWLEQGILFSTDVQLRTW